MRGARAPRVQAAGGGRVAPSAVVAPSAAVAPSAVVEHGAVVMAGAEVGPGCVVGPNSGVGAGVRIGADTVLGHGVSLSHCTVGAGCRFHSGVCVGADGFGMTLANCGQRQDGVVVLELEPGFPAHRSGLLVGDIILSVDGAVTESAKETIKYLKKAPETLTFAVAGRAVH